MASDPSNSVPVRFSIEDLAVLQDALKAWEKKDDMGLFAGDVMGAMLFGGKDTPPEAKAKWERDQDEKRHQREEEQQRREERSVLLRAKLIQWADVLRAEQFTAEVFRP